MSNKQNVLGMKFGMLTVLREDEPYVMPSGQSYPKVMCICDCGKEYSVRIAKLRSGETKSCGCWRSQRMSEANTTHGMRDTRVYQAWLSMRKRTTNQNLKSWKNYGGRGIDVCERWKTFENFYADMGDPLPGQSIDRIDNDGNYEPSNCRWATPIQQARNRRSSVMIEYNGIIDCAPGWAERTGISLNAIRMRIRSNWPIENILTTPLMARKGN